MNKIEKPKQPELAKHDMAVLDLAFVIDCTGSMGSYIESATEVFFILKLDFLAFFFVN
jgi:hypothetical protein